MKSKELKVLLPILLFLLLISRPVSVQGFDTVCLVDESNDVMKGIEQNNQFVGLYTVSFPALDIVKVLVEWKNQDTIKVSIEFSAQPILNTSSYYYVHVEGTSLNYSVMSIDLMFNSISLGSNETIGILIWSGDTSNGALNLNISTHVSSNSVYWEITLPEQFPVNDFKSLTEDDIMLDAVAAIGHYYNDSSVFYWDDTENATPCSATQSQSGEETNEENNEPQDNVSELGNLPINWEGIFLAIIATGIITREILKRKRIS